MGVHGLWELLAPVGRRVSVETLAGKKLAIDASIWMIQFMKAMRDEKGEMVRNAHILGFFRRICKLLYLRTKPVFVFDGGTPALKRRTVIARRRQRENAQAKIRKTAEKLLLNQLKTMRVKELAADLEKQRQEGDPKGKRPIIEESSNDKQTQKGNTDASISYNQEKLDEMLAASIAAEENQGFNIDASSSGVDIPNDEVFDEDDDEDEEMILPEMQGKIDPAVLACLPPSMQLDLLVQMRERLMAENRQKYQKVKKVPARFSELQIEAYLKTVAFRREIDGVQKSAAGRGIGGVQTSRIASEANREFIFSSSFTGDKQALTSVGQERKEADQVEAPPKNSPAKAPPASSPAKAPLANSSANAFNKIKWPKSSDATAGPTVPEIGKAHDEVETYVDERGRLRVSRVRALGIRMTRDLQRNLDLIKEIDQEKLERDQEKNNELATASELEGVLDDSSGRIQLQEATDKNSDKMINEVDKNEDPAFVSGASIEISFEDTSEHQGSDDNDDKLFARLVAGEPVDCSVDNSVIAKETLHSASDNEWVKGFVDRKNTEHLHEEGMSDEGEEVEWEEGFQDIQLKMSSRTDESQKKVTKEFMEKEAAFQEAVIRSLEDNSELLDGFNENHTSERAKETVSYEGGEVEWEEGFEDIRLKSCLEKSQKTVTKGDLEEDAAFQEAIRRSLEGTSVSMDGFHENDTSEKAREMVNDDEEVEWEEDFQDTELKSPSCPDKSQNTVAKGVLEEETAFQEAVRSSLKDTGGSVDDFHENNTSKSASEAINEKSDCEGKEQPNVETFSYDVRKSLDDRLLSSGSADTPMFQVELGGHSVTDVDGAEELVKDKVDGNFSREKDEALRNNNNNNEQEIVEEMMFLDKEREDLGSEQRKHERDAESVSGEMFAECQELLQMFGLPYIIAPMEAEAQCAFMELSNLVDGVVTDDSDAFLFGAQSVYKNIFDDRKYVETYLMKDIENEIGLDREKLIHMALLLGSDYTEGISGIGIVNAIEVVNAFPGKDGLREFREWIESPDPSIFGKFNVETGGNSRKKGSKGTESGITSVSNSNVDGISCNENVPQPVNDEAQRKRQVFMDKHRNVSKNWHISTSFPSDAVVSAYDSPQVDKSTEPFSWGKPDLFVLRRLCWEKFGWGASKADELLIPVLKEYNKHETQLRLEAFYTFNERFAKIRSKRIEKAVKGITGSKSSAPMDETPQQSGSRRKRKPKPFEDEANQSKVDSMEKPGVKPQQSKRGRMKVKNSKVNLEQSRDGSNVRGRGRGGRGRGGRGKRKDTHNADAEISNDDGSSSENDEQVQHISEDAADQIRRSVRVRKTVNYAVSDDEKDETLAEQVGSAKEECAMDEDGGIDKHIENEVSVGGETGIEDGGIDKHMENEVRVGGETGDEDGLLVEETTSMVDEDQMDDPSAPKEYLQFGGGFCLNEEDDKEGEKSPLADELNMHDDESTKFLRAMPNLRRKKRKN